MALTHIKTSSGFECDLNENSIDDAELLELIADLDDDNIMAFPRLCRKLLGAEKEKLYDHIRTEDGRVPYEALNAEIADILHGLNAKKK